MLENVYFLGVKMEEGGDTYGYLVGIECGPISLRNATQRGSSQNQLSEPRTTQDDRLRFPTLSRMRRTRSLAYQKKR
jgi:hypothetical protein